MGNGPGKQSFVTGGSPCAVEVINGAGGGGLFCHKNQSCWKLPEMDRSGVKNFPHGGGGGGGGFSVTKTKVAGHCLKWIDPVSKIFPHPGGLFFHKNQSCWKLPEMDRSSVKKFPSSWGGGALLPAEPKLLEIAWSGKIESKNFPLFGCWGAGAFLPVPQWDVQWCIKYGWVKLCHVTQFKLSISPKDRKEGGGGFLTELLDLSFCQLNTVVFRFIRKTNNAKSLLWDCSASVLLCLKS